MKKKKSIAIDMDGVLADIEAQFVKWYTEKFGVTITYEQMIGKPEAAAFPEQDAIREFVLSPGFFRTLPLMPGAVETVKALMENFEVYIVSAAMEFPQSLSEKLEWLNEHFSFITWKNIVFCGDKSLIGTDYMIDDHIKNLDYFRGKTILFHAAHNVNVTHHSRVKSWTEAKDLLHELEGMGVEAV